MLSSIQMLDVNSHKSRDGDCLYFSVCVCARACACLNDITNA